MGRVARTSRIDNVGGAVARARTDGFSLEVQGDEVAYISWVDAVCRLINGSRIFQHPQVSFTYLFLAAGARGEIDGRGNAYEYTDDQDDDHQLYKSKSLLFPHYGKHSGRRLAHWFFIVSAQYGGR